VTRAASRSGEATDADLSLDARWATRILTRFIEVEVSRTGKRSVVVGLSGGVDSAVSAALARRALGAEAVFGLLLPHRASSPDSLRDARKVVRALGVESETVDITPIVDGFTTVSGNVDRARLGNVMARARMLVLYDRSAQRDALVLGTSNKTELLLGYGTLHGDLASAINPLGDLYKTQVYALARHLGVPRSIRDKPPSADLWPGQSDEDDLGFRYADLDRLLALLVDARVSAAAAGRHGFPPAMVRSVLRRIVGSQFKRRPAVIAKISTRSVGWDFRYPRDWLT